MKKTHKLLIAASSVILAVAASSCIFLPEKEESVEYTKNSVKVGENTYRLVWSDEFDDDALDTTDKWNRVVWAKGKVNREVQAYSADAQYSVVEDGTLKIFAKKSGSNWTSARIDTSDKQKFRYGYVEARIKQPVAYTSTTESEENMLVDDEGNPVNTGVWPAFWMMPNACSEEDEEGNVINYPDGRYGVWPRSGEIDIMEYSPSTHGKDAYATLHHSDSESKSDVDKYPSLGYKVIGIPSYDNKSDWHTYGMLWTEDTLEAFYDGESLGVIYVNPRKGWVEWPYDQDFYLILNLAMGGTLGGDIHSDMKMAVYEIDYVRVYQ